MALVATLFLSSCNKDEVTPAPVADFNIAPGDSVNGGELVTLNNTSTNADTYLWDFGDGTTSTAVNPTKSEFVVEGEVACDATFIIKLTASKDGKSSTKTKNIVVQYCK